MPKSLNKVSLIGHLGKDPELRYTPSGSAVTNFSLATSENWKDGDGNAQERTSWHNIVAWGKLAEITAEYLKKGRQVYIEGRIQYRDYEGKDGNKRYVTEIVASDLIMLGGKQEGEHESKPEARAPQTATPTEKDDLPF